VTDCVTLNTPLSSFGSSVSHRAHSSSRKTINDSNVWELYSLPSVTVPQYSVAILNALRYNEGSFQVVPASESFNQGGHRCRSWSRLPYSTVKSNAMRISQVLRVVGSWFIFYVMVMTFVYWRFGGIGPILFVFISIQLLFVLAIGLRKVWEDNKFPETRKLLDRHRQRISADAGSSEKRAGDE
jgi:hypothetical protein